MIPRVDLPQGFLASGINSGVRRYRPDLGLILSDRPCVAAGTFTRNSLKAAPVLYSRELLPADNIRAIVCNSGQANAATGSEGLEDNLTFANNVAHVLGIESNQVLVASTGVIGVRLLLDTLRPALPTAAKSFSNSINQFGLSIMTTDLEPKFCREEITLSGGVVVVTGAAKGSGMIHPNMGTMLGFILTDAIVEKKWLDQELRRIVDESFNMISVDGETSTNDTVFALANGAAGVAATTVADRQALSEGIQKVAAQLAIAIARDGEGASKLITVNVSGASSAAEAKEAARSITTSPLIKSAMHGEDPNWGRILARLGFAGVAPVSFERLRLELQGVCVFDQGKPQAFDRADARQRLHADNVVVEIDLKNGEHRATAWGCDLTKRYVEINTEYS